MFNNVFRMFIIEPNNIKFITLNKKPIENGIINTYLYAYFHDIDENRCRLPWLLNPDPAGTEWD